MKEYKPVVTADAREDLKDHLGYIKRQFKNKQALTNVREDFKKTAASLATRADTIKDPESEALLKRGLKRINFEKHDYFLLFSVKDDTVEVMRMFHFLQDYENKLK